MADGPPFRFELGAKDNPCHSTPPFDRRHAERDVTAFKWSEEIVDTWSREHIGAPLLLAFVNANEFDGICLSPLV
jgi:hypothetical protein